MYLPGRQKQRRRDDKLGSHWNYGIDHHRRRYDKLALLAMPVRSPGLALPCPFLLVLLARLLGRRGGTGVITFMDFNRIPTELVPYVQRQGGGLLIHRPTLRVGAESR